MNRNEFQNPGQEYRGVTLWMLNDRLEPEELARQAAGFREAGWGALIARTFTGLRTEYLSGEWNEAVRTIIRAAEKNGLKAWLQAGYMPSAIPDLPESDQFRMIVVKKTSDPHEDGETVLLEKNGVRYCEGRVSSVIDLLDGEVCGNYIDRAYTKTLEPEFGSWFGKTVEAVWVDEPHLQPPALTWSRRFPERFEEDWGYSIVENLPSLFSHEGDYLRVRHQYWRTVLRLLLDSYFRQVGRWCTDHDLKFCGHLMGEDTLRAQISWTAACMPGYEYMHLPGIDHLTKSLLWPANLPFVLPPKQCSSASHQLGRREILSEIYAVSTEGMTFADRKRIGDWMTVLGINYRCYHGSFYSIRGRRKRFYVPHLSHQQPWWSDNGIIATYFARFSYMMRRGTYEAEILLLHPVESGFCLYDPTTLASENVHNRVDEPADIRKLNDGFQSLSEILLRLHREYDYGDETLIARHGDIEGTELRVGEMNYRAVILPPLITMRATTFELLMRFADAGGIIFSAGDFPDRIDGEKDARIERLAARVKRIGSDERSIGKALDDLLPSRLGVKAVGKSDAGALRIHRRRDGDERIIALVNTDAENPVTADLTFGETGHLLECDLMTGTTADAPYERVAGGVRVRTELPPGASGVYVLATGTPSHDVRPAQKFVPSRSVKFDDGWSMRRLSPNALTLDFASFRRGTGPWSDPLPVQAIQEILTVDGYRGPVSLRFVFEVKDRPDGIDAVIEDAGDCTAILVNGNAVKYAGLPPYLDQPLKPIDAAPFVKTGTNSIELTRDFIAPVKPKFALATLFHTAVGTELEAIYLTGGFALATVRAEGYLTPCCRRLSPRFTLTAEPAASSGDLVSDGYPFFAGRFVLEREIELPALRGGERLFLTLPGVNAALIKVRVNGTEAGAIAWAPFELEITNYARDGRNRIEFELVSTLRNLLGPHHRPDGEPSQTWADGWTGLSTAERRETKLRAGHDWYAHRNDGTVYWTDDYFFLPFGIDGGAEAEYRKPV